MSARIQGKFFISLIVPSQRDGASKNGTWPIRRAQLTLSERGQKSPRSVCTTSVASGNRELCPNPPLKKWPPGVASPTNLTAPTAPGLTRTARMNMLCSLKQMILRKKTPWFPALAGALTLCVLAGQLAAFGATSPKAQSSSASKGKTGAAKGVISRNPYLGAIVMDAVTGKVLFEDQADAKGYPASMLKMIDLLIVLEKVEQGQLSLQDLVSVSPKAAKTGGSQVWLADKESFPLDDMLYALMVQSANDAAVAIAEKVAGSTEAFVDLMNKKAHELGMNSTVFHSVHGLPPGAGQEHDVTTARDFAILARELLKHNDTLRYTSTRTHTFRPDQGKKTVEMRNHNHLLGKVEGCDGLKTGYITQAGFSIAVTAARHGHRVIVVVLDSVDLKTRDAKAKELVEKGFAALPTPVAAAASPAKPARQ
jgi:D-alanyl-D-alanine carboxypeptidase (penicillin-binding protein 5/6)